MINWYGLGDVNALLATEVPRSVLPIIVENDQPVLFVSNTVNEDGDVIRAMGMIQYRGENMTIPFEAHDGDIYVAQSENYALQLSHHILYLGVSDDIS